MCEEDWEEDEQYLAEVAERLKEGRQALSMAVYAVRHGRRTPDQVRRVIERASRAIQHNRMVRTRWTRLLAVH